MYKYFYMGVGKPTFPLNLSHLNSYPKEKIGNVFFKFFIKNNLLSDFFY